MQKPPYIGGFFMSKEGRYVENAGAYFRRCPRRDGMSKMQEHIFDDELIYVQQ
jgi:hypothetical protein